MEKNEDRRLRLSSKEYRAISDMRGLAHDAHMMVMCASRDDKDNWLMEGSHKDFDALLSDIIEEIGEGLAPKKNVAALRRVCGRIDPGSLEIW